MTLSMSESPSTSSDYSSSDLPLESSSKEKCKVCGKPAFCYNYGVLVCNACKMFFRRVVVDQLQYNCKFKNKCYDGMEYVKISTAKSKKSDKNAVPKCRACRFQRCHKVGMRYIEPGKATLERRVLKINEDELGSMVPNLLLLESRRRHKVFNFFVPEDPTLGDILAESKKSKMLLKKEGQEVSLEEWSFFSVCAAIELFMSLDFADSLETSDKRILLQNYSMKSALFYGSMRSRNSKFDKVMTPDGKDVYPDVLYSIPHFSQDFLNGIRSRLINRLIELDVTNEEHVILNSLFFCNSDNSLSPSAQEIINAQQKLYSSALLRYCLLKYDRSGPSRFADLISLYHVVSKISEDVNHLNTLYQIFCPEIRYKRLLVDVSMNSSS